MTLIGPETGAFPSELAQELALEPKDSVPKQHAPCTYSTSLGQFPVLPSAWLTSQSREAAQKRESDPQGECAALQLLHTQGLRGARVANWQSTS